MEITYENQFCMAVLLVSLITSHLRFERMHWVREQIVGLKRIVMCGIVVQRRRGRQQVFLNVYITDTYNT